MFTNFTNITTLSVLTLTPNSLTPLLIFNNKMARLGFTQDEEEIMRTVSRVFSAFSITGLIFVLIVFWFFRSIRTFAFELVAWLCFSNMLFNISFYLPVYDSDDLTHYKNNTLSTSCTLQSFINIFFDLSSLLWTTIIGYTAYVSVTRQLSLDSNKFYYRLGFILTAYLIPLAFSLMVYFTKTFGPSGVFCWIATEANTSDVWTFTIIYYSLNWFIILLNCYFVMRVIFLLKSELRNEHELIDKYTSKLRLYPLVQIISYIPATINRIYNLSTGRDNFYLMLIQNIFDSLTGLMFSMVYGMNITVKSSVSECLRNLFRRDVEKRNSEVSDNSQNVFSKSLTFISNNDSFAE